MNVAGSGFGRSCSMRSTTAAPAASASPASSSRDCSASMRRALAATRPTRAARSILLWGWRRSTIARQVKARTQNSEPGTQGFRIVCDSNVQFPRVLMSHFLQLLLLLTLIIVAAKMAGALAARIGQPAVFGEILAGLVLGPTVANVLGWPVFAHAVGGGEGTPVLLPLIRDLADIGVLLLMFVAGLETDLEEMRRVGKVAFWAAFGGVVLPMAGGAATAVAFGLPLFWQGLFVGAILTATSVSISAQTLLELGALRTREGSTILGAAVIDDVMGIIVLSLVVAFAKASQDGVDLWQIMLVGLRIAAFFAAGIFAGRWFTPVLGWASRLGVSQAVLAAVLVVAFLYAWAAEYIGSVAAITGSYLAGVLFAQTPFKARIDEGIHPLTYSMFVPIFFISIGLQANARELGERAAFTIVLLVVAIVG